MQNRTIEDLEKIAKKNGWITNPKSKITNSVLKRLNINQTKYGYFACPCKGNEVNKKITINQKEVYTTACPCLNASNEIEENGHCHCHLFFSKI